MMDYGPLCGKDGKCETMYKKRTPPELPPCGTCLIKPMTRNVDAIRIFMVVRDQLIISANGPVGLNHVAVHQAMELYNIKNRKDCFERVLNLGYWWIERNRE